MFFAKSLGKSTPQICKTSVAVQLDSGNAEFRWCSNVKKCGNGLVGGTVRLSELPIGKYVTALPYIDSERFIYFAKDGLYMQINDYTEKLSDITCESAAAINYHETICITSSQIGSYVYPIGDELEFQSELGFDRFVVCCDRMFGAAGNNLYFTDAIGVHKMSEAQQVEMVTPCDAVAAIGNKVYVLGDTCYTFDSDADNIESVIKPFMRGIGKVAPKTVACASDKVVFATDRGLFVLASGKITRIMPQLDGIARVHEGHACMHNGLYYLCCQLNDGKETVLVMDIAEQKIVEVFDGGFSCLYSADNILYALKKGKIYIVHSDGDAACCWGASNIDFKTDKVKHLQQMYVKLRGEADVWIYSSGENRRYAVKGKKGGVVLPVRGNGRSFAVQITSQRGVKIDDVQLVAYLYGEVM